MLEPEAVRDLDFSFEYFRHFAFGALVIFDCLQQRDFSVRSSTFWFTMRAFSYPTPPSGLNRLFLLPIFRRALFLMIRHPQREVSPIFLS